MFWRKGGGEKKLSPKDIMEKEIEQLVPGQLLSYNHPETFGGNLTVVQLNPQYPEKGKKYIISKEGLVDNKPDSKIMYIFDSEKPKEIASWVLDRLGTRFG